MKDIRLDTASHNSILARLERLETKLDALQNSGVQAATLDEISDDLGIIRSGGFWATTSEGVPTSSGWTGVFIDGGGYTFGTTVYPFGGVQNGTLQFGGAYTNGKFMAGGGAVTLDADGIGIAPGTTKTDANAYKFRNSGGTTVGGLSGQVLSGYSTNCMTLESIGNADEQVAQIRLTATHNDTSEVDLDLNTDGGNAVFTV